MELAGDWLEALRCGVGDGMLTLLLSVVSVGVDIADNLKC